MAKRSPRLHREEWQRLLDFCLHHGFGPYRLSDLEALSQRLRARRSEPLLPNWRREDGLRRELAVFKVLAAPGTTTDKKAARLAQEVWDEYMASPNDWAFPSVEDENQQASPRRGPVPSFGPVQQLPEDGPTQVYAFFLHGSLEKVIAADRVRGGLVFKIGWTNDTTRRAAELNSGFPPSIGLRWMLWTTRDFPSAESAHAAEQSLLKGLLAAGASLGGEFAVLSPEELDRLFDLIDSTSIS